LVRACQRRGIRLFRNEPERRRVNDLNGFDRGEAGLDHGLARLKIALEGCLDVLGRQRRAVVELDALAQGELPGRLVDVFPGGRQARLQAQRIVPARERVVEVVEVVHGQDLRAPTRIHRRGLGGLRDRDLDLSVRGRRERGEQGGSNQEELHWAPSFLGSLWLREYNA